MWRNISKLSQSELREFETQFRFTLSPPLAQFLMDHNGGSVTPGLFPTSVRERKLDRLLDIADTDTPKGAWAINRRVRKLIGAQRLVIGVDALDNYICIEREYKQQRIVVWNHVSNQFEECLWDIPAFISYIG